MNNLLEKDHIHSWVKWKKTEKGVYFKCNHPLCYASMESKMLIGKTSLCPQCMVNTFVLTKDDLRRAKPICPQICSMTKKAIVARTLSGGVNQALNKLFFVPDNPRDTPSDFD
jgi:hypothetical protein